MSVKGLSALEGGKRQAPYLHTVTLLAQAPGLTAGEKAALAVAVVPSASKAVPAQDPSIRAGGRGSTADYSSAANMPGS